MAQDRKNVAPFHSIACALALGCATLGAPVLAASETGANAAQQGIQLYEQGRYSEAMPLIRAAADHGDPQAQYVLALAHFNADHAERDWVRAYTLLILSERAGFAKAASARAEIGQFVPEKQRREATAKARDLAAALS